MHVSRSRSVLAHAHAVTLYTETLKAHLTIHISHTLPTIYHAILHARHKYLNLEKIPQYFPQKSRRVCDLLGPVVCTHHFCHRLQMREPPVATSHPHRVSPREN